MAWWQWLVGILLFIVALGVLIGIHELGHLTAAKIFRVYCVDYSIGFGPKLFQTKKSKKHETTWTLRAIPLGGFVAMYGEGMELDDNEYVPPCRSVEGVARYKRAIIVSAGVFLNFILGFILILLHNGCFEHVFIYTYKLPNNNYDTVLRLSKTDDATFNDFLKMNYDPIKSVYVLQENVTISGSSDKYTLVTDGSVATTKEDPSINFIFYANDSSKSINNEIDEAISNKTYTKSLLTSIYVINYNIDTNNQEQVNALNKTIDEIYNNNQNDECFRREMKTYYSCSNVNNYIDLNKKYNVSSSSPDIDIILTLYKKDSSESGQYVQAKLPLTLKLNDSKNGWNDTGYHMKRTIVRYNAGQTFKATWDEWCSANSTIFKALGSIFTGNLSSIGGPVAIAKVSSTVLSNFGFERYLYLWGQISCNLAIINLLPFPGLDGWSLLVVCYEGITKKQIPLKIKSIVSVVGLLLLFGLMAVILIKDIVGLFV